MDKEAVVVPHAIFMDKRHHDESSPSSAAESVYKFWTEMLQSMLPMISCHMFNPIFFTGYDNTGILLDMDKQEIFVHMMSPNTLMFPNPGSSKNSQNLNFSKSSLQPNGQPIEFAKQIIEPYFSYDHCFFHTFYNGPQNNKIKKVPSNSARELCETECFDNECIVSTSLDAIEGIISLQWPPEPNAISLSHDLKKKLFVLHNSEIHVYLSPAAPVCLPFSMSKE